MRSLTSATTRIAAAALLLGVGACATSTGITEGPGGVPAPDEELEPGRPIVAVEHWADFEGPLSLRAPGTNGPWYVVERAGLVWRYDGSDRHLVLDISEEVTTDAEQGLFDLVISPDGQYAYVHFSGTEEPHGDSHIREYEWTGSGVEGEPREVLVVDNPYPHHNGGQLQFGPDGYLYIGLGDGGTNTLDQQADNGDPHDHGQRTDVLLGKVLRIDPRPGEESAYTIPDGNPFVGREGRDEIWAYGLRNPWRFSFDRETGDLWLPDVGHRFQEEINFQPAGSEGGQNFGWKRLEGPLPYDGDEPDDHVLPVYAYPHRGGPCAIIGGYVYRGTQIPDLAGSYVFGDFCTGEIQALDIENGAVTGRRYLGVQVDALTSLAEDRDGELFVLSHTGTIQRIVPVS